jgi:hypothetical protein
MKSVTRLVLDVLKPHTPTGVELAEALADVGGDCRVHLRVMEMDERTETVAITVEGNQLDLPALEACLKRLGASLHSVDEVEVSHQPRPAE